jgi:hypothetical protein
MLKWLKSLFCSHNEVEVMVYYVADIIVVYVYKDYTCKHCGKNWRKNIATYCVNDIPSLRSRGIKSIEEVYNERTCQ